MLIFSVFFYLVFTVFTEKQDMLFLAYDSEYRVSLDYNLEEISYEENSEKHSSIKYRVRPYTNSEKVFSVNLFYECSDNTVESVPLNLFSGVLSSKEPLYLVDEGVCIGSSVRRLSGKLYIEEIPTLI
jgi:hypothetical protein